MFRIKFISIFCVAAIILLSLRCSHKEDNPIRLIKFSNNVIVPLTKFSGVFFIPGDSLGFAAIPIHNGDILVTYTYYLPTSVDLPDTLIFEENDSVQLINNHITAIIIEDGTEGKISPEYLEKLTDREISFIRTIMIYGTLTDIYKAKLKRIIQLNPAIDFILEEDSAEQGNQDLAWLLQYINSKCLVINFPIDSTNLSNLSRLNKLEILWLEKIQNEVLPTLKSLKMLVLGKCYDEIDTTFFNENLGLERLSVFDKDLKISDNPPWHVLKNLSELNINVDSIGPYSFAKYHPRLKTLTLSTFQDFSTIAELKNLQWLSLGDPLTDQEFTHLTNSFPKLEMLSIKNTDSLKDFSQLKKLSILKYLTITESAGLDRTLYGFKNLESLSLPAELLDDTIRLNKLKKALPNTIITPNGGACMGSGWLLILLPLSGVWLFLQHQHRKIKHFERVEK